MQRSLSENLEERIVREVMRRLRRAGREVTVNTESGGRVAEAWQLEAKDLPLTFTLCERVISLAVLEDVEPEVRQLKISRRAVVTPAAHDWIRQRGLVMVREDLGGAGTVSASAGRLALAAELHVTGVEPIEQLMLQLAGPVPLVRDSSPDAVCRRVAELAGDGRRIVWLTARPLVAVCRANRHTGLRAAWAIDLATVQTALEQLDANVLIAEPNRHSQSQWRQIVDVVSGESDEC